MINHSKRHYKKYISPNTKQQRWDFEQFCNVKCRVVKFRINDPDTGRQEWEVLLTNLNRFEFPIPVMKEMYHSRWDIETSFRELKYALGGINFHSKKDDFIKMELWSHFIMFNAVSMNIARVKVPQQADNKWNYAVDFKMACTIKHIEFYSKQGYFTLSGDVYRNKPIEERSHEGQRFFHSIKWKQTQEREERRSSQAHGYDDIREELKSHLTEYVESKTQRDPKAGKNKYICPICGSGSRGGRGSDGAFTLYPETNSFYCFSCGKGGDIFNLISEVEHLSNFRDQYKRTLELYKPDLLRKEVDKRLQAEQTDTLLTFDKITKALREDNQAIINIEGFPELTKILKLRKHTRFLGVIFLMT